MKVRSGDKGRRTARQVPADAMQDLSAYTAEEFREFLRGEVRALLMGCIQAEVDALCGPSYCPNPDSECRRAGSAPGYVLHQGRRQDIIRPRVRRRSAESEEEVQLATYANAKEPGELRARILDAFSVGVSGRDQSRLHGEETPGTSKSEVSRLWRREGAKRLSAFRERSLVRNDWLVLMLDGVWLDKELMAVVALGVAADGTKHILDFELGATESTETAKGLLARLARRGFAPADEGKLLVVLDGSKALKSAVLSYWPDAITQRCLVHKERNVRRFLRRKDWKELAGNFDRLRKAQGAVTGQEVLKELERFVGERNQAALESLREAGDELLALHRLEVPATLHVSLLSTNLIEGPFRNMRRKLERVSRWRAETDQASRWLAYGLLEAERGFKRVRHAGDLSALRRALRKSQEAVEA